MVPDLSYSGRCFLYVLAVAGPEDVLKVGMTGDPLGRWSAFHPRWFEIHDLDHSLLVETETRADARALETTLHRLLAEHRCPMPLNVRMGAGGATEWYRGAYPTARNFALEREREGYIVHHQAWSWLGPAMATEREKLPGLLHQAFEDRCSGLLSAAQLDAIRHLTDAHQAFGADIDSLIPASVRKELGL